MKGSFSIPECYNAITGAGGGWTSYTRIYTVAGGGGDYSMNTPADTLHVPVERGNSIVVHVPNGHSHMSFSATEDDLAIDYTKLLLQSSQVVHFIAPSHAKYFNININSTSESAHYTSLFNGLRYVFVAVL